MTIIIFVIWKENCLLHFLSEFPKQATDSKVYFLTTKATMKITYKIPRILRKQGSLNQHDHSSYKLTETKAP